MSSSFPVGGGVPELQIPLFSTQLEKALRSAVRASQPRLQASALPLFLGRGRSWEHPRGPVAFGAERARGNQGDNSDPNCHGAEARSSSGCRPAASAEVDASGWEGADRAGGAEPGGSRSRIGRALARDRRRTRSGAGVGDGVGVGVGVRAPPSRPSGLRHRELQRLREASLQEPLRISKRKRSPPFFGKEAFMSFNATTNRRETCEARTTLKPLLHRVLH